MVDKIRQWLWLVTAWAALGAAIGIAHDIWQIQKMQLDIQVNSLKLEFAQWQHFLKENANE